MDLNVAEPRYDVPLWNETRWNGCWGAADGVGLYIHAGRYRAQLDTWWCQLAAFLPDEGLCVERIWGRNASPVGVRMGELDLAMTENGWSSAFDGVGQLTTITELSRAPRGSSAPVRSLAWNITAEAAAPVWDMYGRGQEQLIHGDTHIQQAYRTAGTLRVGDREWSLDGIGFKDHSSGPRKMGMWTGHRFVLIVTDNWVAHAGVMDDENAVPGAPWGAFFRDGEQHDIVRYELAPMEDARGGPVANRLEFEVSNGEVFVFDVQMIHGLPMVISDDNDNINGVDWELGGNPMVFVEGKAKLTAPDGRVVYGYYERSRRRDDLERT